MILVENPYPTETKQKSRKQKRVCVRSYQAGCGRLYLDTISAAFFRLLPEFWDRNIFKANYRHTKLDLQLSIFLQLPWNSGMNVSVQFREGRRLNDFKLKRFGFGLKQCWAISTKPSHWFRLSAWFLLYPCMTSNSPEFLCQIKKSRIWSFERTTKYS